MNRTYTIAPPQAPFWGADFFDANQLADLNISNDFYQVEGGVPTAEQKKKMDSYCKLSNAEKTKFATDNKLSTSDVDRLTQYCTKMATDLTADQKAQLAQGAANVYSAIQNRKRNEYKQGLKTACGMKPLLKHGKHKDKYDAWLKCANDYKNAQNQKSPDDKSINNDVNNEVLKENTDTNNTGAGDKIWGMPKPVVYVGGIALVGLLIFFGYKMMTKGKK